MAGTIQADPLAVAAGPGAPAPSEKLAFMRHGLAASAGLGAFNRFPEEVAGLPNPSDGALPVGRHAWAAPGPVGGVVVGPEPTDPATTSPRIIGAGLGVVASHGVSVTFQDPR